MSDSHSISTIDHGPFTNRLALVVSNGNSDSTWGVVVVVVAVILEGAVVEVVGVILTLVYVLIVVVLITLLLIVGIYIASPLALPIRSLIKKMLPPSPHNQHVRPLLTLS